MLLERGLAGRWVLTGSQRSRCFLFMLINLDFRAPLSLEVEVPFSLGDWKHLQVLRSGLNAPQQWLAPAGSISAQIRETHMQHPLGAMLVISETAAFPLVRLGSIRRESCTYFF